MCSDQGSIQLGSRQFLAWVLVSPRFTTWTVRIMTVGPKWSENRKKIGPKWTLTNCTWTTPIDWPLLLLTFPKESWANCSSTSHWLRLESGGLLRVGYIYLRWISCLVLSVFVQFNIFVWRRVMLYSCSSYLEAVVPNPLSMCEVQITHNIIDRVQNSHP